METDKSWNQIPWPCESIIAFRTRNPLNPKYLGFVRSIEEVAMRAPKWKYRPDGHAHLGEREDFLALRGEPVISGSMITFTFVLYRQPHVTFGQLRAFIKYVDQLAHLIAESNILDFVAAQSKVIYCPGGESFLCD